MAVVNTSNCNFGWKAENFNLLSVNGNYYSLDSLKGQNGTLIAFICNHCPYFIYIAERLSYEAKELKKIKINSIAIMSNDVDKYPEDSFENMKLFFKNHNLDFPYLYDEDQNIARIYNAQCTPDFFGFNSELKLQYRGRLDSSGRSSDNLNVERDLFNAMKEIAKSGNGPKNQIPSIGCSIKWKNQ